MKTQGTSTRPATVEEYIEASPVQARAMPVEVRMNDVRENAAKWMY